MKNKNTLDDYIKNISAKIKTKKEFQGISKERLEKFFENFEILAKNLELLGIELFEDENKIRFSGSIQNQAKKLLEEASTRRQQRACTRILKHININIIIKMGCIERFVSDTCTDPDKLKDCIIQRVVPFILGMSLQKKIALP